MKRLLLTVMLCSLSFMLGSVGAADKSLILYMPLDDGAGTVAKDASPYQNDGAILGNAGWIPGQIGGALDIVTGSSIEIQEIPEYDVTSDVSLLTWMKTTSVTTWARMIDKSQWQDNGFDLVLTLNVGIPRFEFFVTGTTSLVDGTTVVMDGEWHFVVGTFGDQTLRMYVDGVQEGEAQSTGGVDINPNDWPIRLGAETNTGGQQYVGQLDEVAIFNRALSADEVLDIFENGMPGANVASRPLPENEAADLPRKLVLAWTPSELAATHNVYFGTNRAEVEAGQASTLIGDNQDANSIDLGRVDYDQTYYWRVDEVNSAPDFTVFEGEIWSFTAEPFSYPIETITATASSSHADNMGPDKTIDGSGLNMLDQHSVDGTHMWLSGAGVVPAWIQYEFDKVYKLDQMWVWNSNQIIEAFMGLGAKDVIIESSIDGTDWVELTDVEPFAQATGSPDYAANTVVDFTGTLARFVKITVNSGYGFMPQYGLSEVRFFSIPVQAREPMPASGALVDGVDVLLKWRAGREAAQHEVYLGTDSADLALVGTSDTASYDLSAAGLEYGVSYFWQVTEVNDTATPSAYAGEIWSFTTLDFLAVDDFESYNDECGRIFFAWQDGWGHNGGENIEDCDVPPYGGNGTGALVGNDQAPFAERMNVHAGRQSMPMGYDGAGSEAQLSLPAPQDWTMGGAQTLIVFFAGTPGNDAGQFYVKINGTKLVHPSQTALQQPVWKQWNINLSSLGINLTSIRTLSLGVDSSGVGTVYVDDLRLYRSAAAVPVPADPGAEGLMALYSMENNLQDSTGNGYDGVAPNVAAAYTDGPGGIGAALSLSGDDFGDDYVELPIGSLIASLTDATFALWVDYSGQGGAWQRIFDFGSGTSQFIFLCPIRGGDSALLFEVNGPGGGTNLLAAPFTMPTDWHHVAGVVDSSSMELILYLDGAEVGRTPTTDLPSDVGETTQNWLGRSQFVADPFYNGAIDDFRIYGRALTQEEILYLAGDR
jgi:hypothetical protein